MEAIPEGLPPRVNQPKRFNPEYQREVTDDQGRIVAIEEVHSGRVVKRYTKKEVVEALQKPIKAESAAAHKPATKTEPAATEVQAEIEKVETPPTPSPPSRPHGLLDRLTE